MVLSPTLAKIKEDFDKVITFSQNIENPQTDKLFEVWLECKRDFIEVFNGELIYEYPEKVSFELGPKEKHERVMQFSADLANRWGNSALGCFIEEQESGFFDNITIDDFTTYDGKVIKKGTKLVKAFKHFVNDKRSLIDIQNEASRIIQEDKIEGRLCFSVHPLDFLSLSENTYNWRSCHALDGEYRAGNLSYMMDKSTIICYLKAENNTKLPSFPHDVPWNSKKWRVLLYFSNDWKLLFSGRQYPFETSTGMDFVLKTALSKAKLCVTDDGRSHWSDWNRVLIDEISLSNGVDLIFDSPYIPIGTKLKPLDEVVIDGDGSKHYNDVLSSSCYKPIYAFKYLDGCWGPNYMAPIPDATKCNIGGYTYCLYCGKEEVISGADTMMCDNCELNYGSSDNDLFTYCDSCGRRTYTDDTYVVNDQYICPQCYDKYCTRCENCEEVFFNEDIHYHDDLGQYLCDECYEEIKGDM